MATVSQPASDDAERRIAPRTRILKRGKILFNNRYSTFDCTVRNISATGALLTIDPAVPLPKLFEIRIGEEEGVRPAKLVYRRDSFAGIHFMDAAEDASEANAAGSPATAAAELRIHPRPLPAGLAAHLPWTQA